ASATFVCRLQEEVAGDAAAEATRAAGSRLVVLSLLECESRLGAFLEVAFDRVASAGVLRRLRALCSAPGRQGRAAESLGAVPPTDRLWEPLLEPYFGVEGHFARRLLVQLGASQPPRQ
ncbi:unnamed protein product, partial [Polarella glacialis]